jgi:hypothetical protein
MLQRLLNLGHWILLGILFVSLGGHLALLQTVAWGNMLVDYSKSASFSEAAKMTFDGGHPCSLCKVVEESKKQEEKKPLLKATAKMEVALPLAVRLNDPVGKSFVIAVPEYDGQDSRVRLEVPVRPPRLV